MNFVSQFLQYNLLPAVLAGLISWLLVYAAIILFKIQHSSLRLMLLLIPVVKSLLVLLGIGLVFRWPRDIFSAWQAQALPFEQVIPILLVWFIGVYILRTFLEKRARSIVIGDAQPLANQFPRLTQSLDRVRTSFDTCPAKMVGEGMIFCVNRELPNARLLLSDEINSPLVVTSEAEPTIVIPTELVPELTDDELDGALAHEFAHFLLRNPAWYSSNCARHITPLSPIAALLAFQFRHEEEKACDDMAVTALGKPEVYADMLLKSFRFAAGRSNPLQKRLQVLPQLLGAKPFLTERIERLLQTDSPQANIALQYSMVCLVMIGIWALAGIQ